MSESVFEEPLSENKLQKLCEEQKREYLGLQGEMNSCYMDATLFAMFAMNGSFDYILNYPLEQDSNPLAFRIQESLREMVHELRSYGFVNCKAKRKFREYLALFFEDEPFENMEWEGSENDPAEFIQALFEKVLKIPPFLPKDGIYVVNLWPDRGPIDRRIYATYQNVVDSDRSNLILNEIPENLILKLPLIGESASRFRHWMKNMVPSLTLDITDHVKYAPKQCCICGIVASLNCEKCFAIFGENRSSEYFCSQCLPKCHEAIAQNRGFNDEKTDHLPRFINYNQEEMLTRIPPRIVMSLHAVICFKQSHYTCFVREGTRKDDTWFYFDSMAQSDSNTGECVPKVTTVPLFSYWCGPIGIHELLTQIYTGEFKHLYEKMQQVELQVLHHQIVCNPTILFYNKPEMIYV